LSKLVYFSLQNFILDPLPWIIPELIPKYGTSAFLQAACILKFNDVIYVLEREPRVPMCVEILQGRLGREEGSLPCFFLPNPRRNRGSYRGVEVGKLALILTYLLSLHTAFL